MPPMQFTPSTRIADALAADPALVERLIAVNPVFRKLNNPVLRRTLARLATFADAAKVSGVPLPRLLAVANGQDGADDAAAAVEPDAPPPAWIATVDAEAAIGFDARPLLARGEEPFRAIMQCLKKVPAGGDLIVEAPFDPAPLRRLLGGKGFASHASRVGADHWRVYFRRDGGPPRAGPPPPGSARQWDESDALHVDVRGLEPPQPMLAILRLAESCPPGREIVVHHEREPMFLYPELAARGWSWEIVAGEPGEVRLRLRRGG